MFLESSRRARSWIARLLPTALVLAVAPALAPLSGAAADPPPAAVLAPFNAPTCEGSIDTDPLNAAVPPHPAGWSDLTLVSGERLDSYNAGNVVPLYDNNGVAAATAGPPVCGVFYDPEIGGPASTWMFCTDARLAVCADVGPDGELRNGGTDVGFMEDLPTNPKLSPEDERLIAYLIRFGYDNYDRTGWSGPGVEPGFDTAASRWALQGLIWCISDPDYTSWAALQTLCGNNLDPAERAAMLAAIPQSTVIEVDLDTTVSQVSVGESALVTVRTNVFEQPIQLTTSGPADLAVCGGDADLTGAEELIVHGTDPTVPVTIELCLTAQAAGSFTLAASAKAMSAEHLQWAQADPDCQVFARFEADEPQETRDELTIDVLVPTVPTVPTVPAVPTDPGTPLVKTRPKLTTKASHQVAKPGAKLFDRVRISGFTPGHGSRGKATLYGPFSSVNRSVCKPANAVATVRFRPRNGVVRTPKVRVNQPGYYTWVAEISADSHNRRASHRCGLKRETTLVRKPSYPVPVVATGFSGISEHRTATPARLRIPALGINVPVDQVGLRKRAMMVPGDVRRVGRLDRSAGLGDKIGRTVVAGHVSDRQDRPGGFWNLRRARRGQVVTVGSGPAAMRYRITSVQRFDRSRPLPRHLFRTTGKHQLVLISCSDKVTYPNGRWHYTNNVVVTAVPIGKQG